MFEVTFDLQGHGASIDAQNIVDGGKVTKPDDPVAIGWDFGGWFTDAECTAGNEWDFDNDVVTAATPLFAKWTAFGGCTLLVPATSGDAPAVGDPISMQSGSKGGSMSVIGTPLSYNTYGLGFDSNASAKAKVTINNEIQEGTVISLTLVANGTSARGLHLYTGDGSSKVETLGWTSEVVKYTEATFTYTVQSTDVALIGSNEFQLWRNNSVFLKELTVTNCGDPVISHNLTSAVNIAGKGTVTLGASSVREGHTTTATYSDIDAAYEFVSWSISGAGASIADATANPATITMGTEDAVVTLNLQVKPVYYTVTYYDGASEMGTEQVAENGHPTATGIATKKLGYNFLGWSETDGGAVVNLNDITITVAKNLYAKYEAVVCPTSGTVYKFEVKEGLASENLPTSTNKDMSSYVDETGDGYLTYTATADNKAVINDNGTIQMKDATAAYLKVELACALAAGDQIRSHITGNPMRVQVGTTYDSSKDLILEKNAYDIVEITSAMVGAQVLYITRSSNGNANIADFEIYRRPALTGVTVDDLTVRETASATPVMTLLPSAEAIVTSQAWSILSGDDKITINPTTGVVTGVAEGDATIKVVMNGDPTIYATATVHVVENFVQQDVTESIVWDFSKAGVASSAFVDQVLANVDGVTLDVSQFDARKLVGSAQNIASTYFQGTMLTFNATVAGKISVRFTNGNANVRTLKVYVGDPEVEIAAWSYSNAATENKSIDVPAGKVTLRSYQDASPNNVRIMNLEFLALAHQRTSGYAAGDLGTVCLEDATIIEGANLYELAGLDQYGYLAFDQILSGELEAGKPYLFEVTNPSNISFYKPVGADHSDTEIANKGMIGTFTGTTLNQGAEDYYYFSGRHIWKVNDFTVGVPIPAHRCYVDMDVLKTAVAAAPMPGRVRMTIGVNGKNTPTAIDNAEASDKPAKMLINGQLFILRGDKTYDVTGKLVK